MRSLPISKRWLIAGGVVIGLFALVMLTLGVIYPRVGAYMVREKVGGRLAGKLGRKVTFGEIEVSLGHAVLRNIEIRGPLDGEMPLVHIDRIDVDFDTTASFIGKVEPGAAIVDGVHVTVRRDKFGRDNVRDIFERVEEQKKASGGSTLGSLRPTKLTVTKITVLADDALTGTTALVGDADATWTPALLVANAHKLSATTPGAPKAELASINVRKAAGVEPVITVEGGELAVYKELSFSGIGGKIVADPTKKGEFIVDLAGGWGGVPGQLWTAKGHFDPRKRTGAIDLEAAKFHLERLAPILARSGVVDYAQTTIDTKLHLAVNPAGAFFSGDLNLAGLNVGHPMIADKDVHGLDLSAKVEGTFETATRALTLTKGDFVARDVPFSITGLVTKPPRDPSLAEFAPVPVDKPAPPMRGPSGIQQIKLRLVIPPITCQRMLDAIPPEMAPAMQGYKLKGTFHTDVRLEIDWNNLDNLVFGGSVGLNKCKVVDEPEDSPKKLEEPFEHFVEFEKDEWMSFIVGPENPDYVPIADISPNLIKSVTTTEDGAFYKHHGFIVSQFRTALLSDLKARAFRHGASSITMQMVKNVLLFRQKTLARKLQELFLTWHVENTLEKDRILEIYFNVIEYGPGLYGIGPAARHYFGKSAKDITPTEAAFFSSILPSPKVRYKQYCEGTLTKWTTAKVERILKLMLSREKITQEEYDKAIATPLVFVKDDTETEKECLERVKKAIENARSTNPMLQDDDDKDKKGKKKGDKDKKSHPRSSSSKPD